MKQEKIFWQRRQVRLALVQIQLILLYFPILKLFLIRTDNGSIPASLCYFFSIIFFPYLICALPALKLPPWPFTGFFVFLVGMAAFRMPQYGLSKSILHWVFGFYLLVVILNIGADFKREDWLKLLERGACLFACIHFLYLFTQWDTITWLLNGYFTGTLDGNAGVYLSSLTRGGRNLDATWLGMGALFVKGRKKAIYVTYAILFSFLGGSRAGCLAIGLVILWSLAYDPIYRLRKNNIKWYVLYGAVMLTLLFCTGSLQAFTKRLQINLPAPLQIIENFNTNQNSTIDAFQFGDSPKQLEVMLSGRNAIWRTVPIMVKDNPFGYGVGNAMRVMRSNYGFSSNEDVVHNVFLQLLVDEGFIGGLWFLGMAAFFLYSQRQTRFKDAIPTYLLVYLILSLIQFHGGEALMIFVLGIYLVSQNQYINLSLPRNLKLHREQEHI